MLLFCDQCKASLEVKTDLIPTYRFDWECLHCHTITLHDLTKTAPEITDREITDPMLESLEEPASQAGDTDTDPNMDRIE